MCSTIRIKIHVRNSFEMNKSWSKIMNFEADSFKWRCNIILHFYWGYSTDKPIFVLTIDFKNNNILAIELKSLMS